MKNALMPAAPGVMSEPLPEIGAAPMRAAPMAKPVKKRNPLVNALSTVFEYGAPEAFEAGRQKRMTRDAGKALAGGNYEQAANTYLQGGNIEQGLKLRSEGEAQTTAKRQQEAQSVLSLFSQMPALQINDMAMSDPANFERMTGMTSEEYLAAAQRSGDPEKFREYVIAKAQAELGQMPAGPAEGKVVNNRLVDPITGEVRGDYSDPTKPPGYEQITLADGEYEYIPGQPESLRKLGNSPVKPSGGGSGSYGLNVIYGRNKAGNRVALQANSAGGVDMANLPEGVTLEDDYSRTFDRETAKNDAKKAAYESTAGQALTAFEVKTDELLLQIDDAVEKTTKGNTGLLGQFIAAGDLDGVLSSIGAKAMLSELVAIKAQGGTLGALSDSEGKALRDAAVNVARSQSEEQLDRNLKAYRLQVENSRMRLKQAFEDEYVNGPNAVRRPAAPAAPAATAPNLFENLMNMYLPK
jgi:hypothetical protein